MDEYTALRYKPYRWAAPFNRPCFIPTCSGRLKSCAPPWEDSRFTYRERRELQTEGNVKERWVKPGTEGTPERMKTLKPGAVIEHPFPAKVVEQYGSRVVVEDTSGNRHSLHVNSPAVPLRVKAPRYRPGYVLLTDDGIYWLVRRSNDEGLLRYTPSDLSQTAETSTLSPEAFWEKYPGAKNVFAPAPGVGLVNFAAATVEPGGALLRTV